MCSFLEYVPGGSVGSVLRKHGKFDDGTVRSFSHQIIDGLAYLHASGILHRVSLNLFLFEAVADALVPGSQRGQYLG